MLKDYIFEYSILVVSELLSIIINSNDTKLGKYGGCDDSKIIVINFNPSKLFDLLKCFQ